jgi:inorganic triphosphatase YgiF
MLNLEVESKYKSSDPCFFGLLQAEDLSGYTLGTSEEQNVSDYYMDTAERDIWRRGYACRMREKNGQWLATVKGLGGVEGAIHQREEYEMEIQPGTLPQQWPNSPARDLVLSLIGSKPLVQLCVIRQHRTKRAVNRGKRRVGAMSLDVVDIESGEQRDRTYEVEIELEQNGTLEDLRILDRVLQDYGLHPESRSKFERAMARFNRSC